MTAPDRHLGLSDGRAEPQPGLPAPGEMAGRFALIIATSDYDDPSLRRLRSPGRDAEEMAELLGNPSIGAFDVQTLMAPRLTDALLRIFEFCEARDPTDLALVYLSCHGILDDHGRLYYATSETRCNALPATAVAARWLNDMLEDYCRARQQILILDCCHSGAFARGTKGGSPLTAIQERFRGSRGRIVMTASRAMEYSFEDERITGDGVSSTFTSMLAKGLRTGDADHDGDGAITVRDLYDYVSHQVRAVELRQNPMLWAYGTEGDLLFAYSVRGVNIKPAELSGPPKPAELSSRPGIRPWQAPVGATVTHLAASEDMLYVANANQYIYAFDASNGHRRWRSRPGGNISVLAASHGTVYAAADRQVAALGELPWTFEAEATIRVIALGAGVVYVGTNSRKGHAVIALDAGDGSVNWRTELSAVLEVAAVAVAGGAVYIGAESTLGKGHVIALDANYGSTNWRTEVGDEVTAVAVAGEAVYIGMSYGRVCALQAGSGKQLWRSELNDSVYTLTAHDGFVYISTEENYVHALKADTGYEQWWYEADSIGMITVAGDTLYIGTPTSIVALNALTGTPIRRSEVSSGVSALLASGDILYLGAGQQINAFDRREENWPL